MSVETRIKYEKLQNMMMMVMKFLVLEKQSANNFHERLINV